MRTAISSAIVLVALWSGSAQALVKSECVTPRGIPRGRVEILSDAGADRRRPCRGFQTEIKTAIVAIEPHERAFTLGLVPEGVDAWEFFEELDPVRTNAGFEVTRGINIVSNGEMAINFTCFETFWRTLPDGTRPPHIELTLIGEKDDPRDTFNYGAAATPSAAVQVLRGTPAAGYAADVTVLMPDFSSISVKDTLMSIDEAGRCTVKGTATVVESAQ